MVTAAPPVTGIDWPISHRIIRTIYPPIWLFEDIADPADWDLIASAEAKTNPRVREQVGDLSLVPVHRRLFGPTASLAMSAFTHVSRDRPGRFSNGSYGVWYCGDRFEVALMETAHHFERFMRRTDEPAGDAQYRELTARIVGSLHDLRDNQFVKGLRQRWDRLPQRPLARGASRRALLAGYHFAPDHPGADIAIPLGRTRNDPILRHRRLGLVCFAGPLMLQFKKGRAGKVAARAAREQEVLTHCRLSGLARPPALSRCRVSGRSRAPFQGHPAGCEPRY
jgi:hypothetical protein